MENLPSSDQERENELRVLRAQALAQYATDISTGGKTRPEALLPYTHQKDSYEVLKNVPAAFKVDENDQTIILGYN